MHDTSNVMGFPAGTFWFGMAAGTVCAILICVAVVYLRRRIKDNGRAEQNEGRASVDALDMCRRGHRSFSDAVARFRKDYFAYLLDRTLLQRNVRREVADRLRKEYGRCLFRPFFSVATSDEKGQIDFSDILSAERAWLEERGQTPTRDDMGGQIEAVLKDAVSAEVNALIEKSCSCGND